MIQLLKRLFVPSADNHYRPDMLERVAVVFMLVMVLMTFAMANMHAIVWVYSDRMVSSVLPGVIIDRTNEERRAEQVPALVRNSVLDYAATLKAEDMAEHGYFGHYSPTGVSPWYWFDRAGYDFRHAGENLAVHFTDSSGIVDAWMSSPSHEANIMDGKYTDIGVGVARGEYNGYPTVFVVQLFGTLQDHARAEGVQDTPSEAVYSSNIDAQSGEDGDTASAGAVSSEQNTVVRDDSPATLSDEYIEVIALAERSPEEDGVVQGVNTDDTSRVSEVRRAQYAGLATTSRIESTPLRVIERTPVDPVSEEPIGFFERTVTQPHAWLQIVYGIFAFIVLVALILTIIIEWRRQQPIQVAYACGLLTIMGMLYHIHIVLTSNVTIL